MPLDVERHCSRVPPQRGAGRRGAGSLVIGLVNNMPDTALEATEAQFARLLSNAADSVRVRLRLSFLLEVPRGEVGRAHLDGGTYWPIESLLREPLDALIVTGMEPVAPLLSDEPYWQRMGELLSWAETNTTSSIWSCLAAHAAVELLDGIRRRRLDSKRCGVFAHTALPNQPLLEGLEAPIYTPHSRWNELPVEQLRSAGYSVVTSSPETGADMFIKQSRSLLVFFQGHPEYEETTLLREYRRDVGRFLRGQQDHYPTLPHEYFPPAALRLLSEYQKRVAGERSPDLLAEFPTAAVADTLRNTWGAGACLIYRNWLAKLANANQTTQTQSPAKVSSSRL
ncbi:MAG TPA: homoserine O-succinyltransferase [Steroidobacteraceae bacterium]